ncbi:MAG TPA: alpha/beta fold hydrolase [Bacteroidota bacterium]|nr:alpha/beta fold hydrolase [Bacteroidota bacterium]
MTTVAFIVLATAAVAVLPAAAQTRYDLFISTLTADSLDATYFIPPTAPPPNGYPGIVFVHGFGGSKNDDTANGRVYSASGYVTLAYSVRGHGLSSEGSTIMSVREREDLAEVVDFMRAIPGIDTNAVGISGGSQGGLHGLWAIADRLPVKAVSSDVIVPGWAADMLMNGSVRRTVVNLLKSSRVSYDPVRDTLWDYVRNDQFDQLSPAFTAGRDVDTAALNSATVPSIRFLKWQDHYFSAADGIAAFLNYSGPKKLYLGTLGHFSDQVESERLYTYDQVTRWLSYHLKGIDNGIMDEPMYTFAESSLPMDSAGYYLWTRTGLDAWPPPGVQPYRFYLSTDSTLTYPPPSAPSGSLYIANVHADSAYTFDTGYIEGFRGPLFENALPRQALSFDSDPLPWDVEWVGSPRMELHVSSPSVKFPLHAQIYEVDTGGTKYFVNRINYTARNWPGGDGVVAADGLAHAHRFAAGSRIRLELTNIDVTNRIDLGSYPFVLPMFADAEVTIHADASRPSFIELPLAQPPTGVDVAGAPPSSGPALLQNYPNPFNGATTIAAIIPAAGRATLAVYNVLGQEVERIADGDIAPGRHAFRWDASAQPTGVYFARLTVAARDGSAAGIDPVHAVKKLMLMR